MESGILEERETLSTLILSTAPCDTIEVLEGRYKEIGGPKVEGRKESLGLRLESSSQ